MGAAELPSWLARAFGIAAVVVLIALGAHVKLFLPGNCYITVGIVGGPVFALGPGGVAYLAGATGGYLAGFVAAAGVVGVATRAPPRGEGAASWQLAAGLLAGGALILLLGWAHLALLARLPSHPSVAGRGAAAFGVLDFVPGDLLKVAAAWTTVMAERRLTRRGRRGPDASGA
jgi:biotin transport system substrate-specific component